MSKPPGKPASIFSHTVRSDNAHRERPQNKSDSSIIISGNKPTSNILLPAPRKPTVARCSSLNRSRTGTALSVKPTTPRQAASNDKMTRPQNSTPGRSDKNTISHFCTPQRSRNYHNRSASTPRRSQPLSPVDINQLPSATPDYFSRVQFDTPANKTISQGQGLADDLQLGEESSNLTVGVRVRPLSVKEAADPSVSSMLAVDGNQVVVSSDNGTTHSFTYDHCFSSCDPLHAQSANQDAVFTALVHPLVDTAFKGYNACLLAYGQTGSGKSYSMMGTDIDTGSCVGSEAGIIPRFCFELFERIDSLDDSHHNPAGHSNVTVEISYFEIYNEKIHDLLGASCGGAKRPPLRVREHPVLGPYVVDLSLHGVSSYADLQGWLTLGNGQRATAATGMNDKSSRSHAIFSIVLTRTQQGGLSWRSRINLVDLAGSERLAQTCVSGERLKEAVSINCSLLTLKKVMVSLAENTNNRKRGFVPYRDSVLTWLLRESLGGNSRTTMLATVSPCSSHLEETLATLRYACQARSIVNRVRKNENPNDKLIRELREEVERLRTIRQEYEQRQSLTPRRAPLPDTPTTHSTAEVDSLKEQLKQAEDNLLSAQKTWSERLEESVSCKSEALQQLRQTGVAVQLDWDRTQSCLVNLASDPMLSGTLFYVLPPGSVTVGRPSGDHKPDIALEGPLIYQLHCRIVNEDGRLSVRPGRRGETFINGSLAASGCSVPLSHGDRLVVGGNHLFRVHNPQTASQHATTADYEYAQQELTRVQEQRLERELQEAKQAALEQLEAAKSEAEERLEKQRATYEETINRLGTNLTLEKDVLLEALKEAQKTSEDLTEQIRALSIQRQQNTTLQEEEFNMSPMRSTFLKDLEDVLNESVQSLQSPSNNSLGLYHMDKMMQEATRLCKEHGVHYVFSQQQVLDSGGLEAMILVRDVANCRTALWTRSHFLDWLALVRDGDDQDDMRDTLETDTSWREDEQDETDTPDRRISVNTRSVTRQLNDSINAMTAFNDSVARLSMDDSVGDVSRDTTTFNDSVARLSMDDSVGDVSRDTTTYADDTANRSMFVFTQDELQCVMQELEERMTELRGLCGDRGGQVTVALDSIEHGVEHLRLALNLPAVDVGFVKRVPTLPSVSPLKPTLRQDTTPVRPRKHKAVRFSLDTSGPRDQL